MTECLMSDEFDPNEPDERLTQLMSELPRESVANPRELDHLVTALQAEGFLQSRARQRNWSLQVAAAIVLAVASGYIGARIAARNSLEARLERTDLTIPDRILLMQRAGSAYVRATNAYAAA